VDRASAAPRWAHRIGDLTGDLPGVPPSGAWPDWRIEALTTSGALARAPGASPIQPCSLDLTLSSDAWRMPASVLPITEGVRELIDRFARRRLDLDGPEIFDQGQIYVARLNEKLRLPKEVGAYCNTRSSVGRVDVQTRVLCDATPRYDKVPRGYEGEIFLEIISKSFDVSIPAGSSLTQAIFYSDRRILDARELRLLAEREPLLLDREGAPLLLSDLHLDDGGVILTVDLDQDPVGWVARRTSQVLRLGKTAANEPEEFFEPIRRPKDGRLWLRRDHFYILSTREYLRVPSDFAVEMLPYDTSAGEFRAHYAGFFDPGFGWSPGGAGRGTPAVLEVRPHDDDLILRHGQPICKMAFEALAGRPSKPYGDTGGSSHYQAQRGPKLSRFFR
jgi:dCTP deaminase